MNNNNNNTVFLEYDMNMPLIYIVAWMFMQRIYNKRIIQYIYFYIIYCFGDI